MGQLTNYSLNKKSENYKHSDAADGGDDGSKRPASIVFEALRAAGKIASAEALWDDIGQLVGRALACLQPVLAVAKTSERKNFQVLGVDILLDAKARPFLLEINDHPSLRIDLSYDEPGQYSMNGLNSIPSPVDEAIKVPMLASALRLVGKEHSLRVGRRRRAKPKKATRAADGSAEGADDEAADDEAADDTAPTAHADGPDVEEAEADDDGEVLNGAGNAQPSAGEREAPTDPPSATSAARPHPTDGVHGTAFHAVPMGPEEGFELISRLASLFERHTPASVRREAVDATRASRHAPLPDALAVPGPRWKGPAPFGAFLSSAGILSRGAFQAKDGGTLARPDLDLIFLAVCGKGGSMDVMDFAEACVRVAQRLWPERAGEYPSELLEALLDTYFADDMDESHD